VISSFHVFLLESWAVELSYSHDGPSPWGYLTRHCSSQLVELLGYFLCSCSKCSFSFCFVSLDESAQWSAHTHTHTHVGVIAVYCLQFGLSPHPTHCRVPTYLSDASFSCTVSRSVALCKQDCEIYEGVSKSLRTGPLERELQMVQLSVTRCSCIAILWVSLVSFAAITLCDASQRVFVVVVYFVIESVRKLLDTPYTLQLKHPVLHAWFELRTFLMRQDSLEKWPSMSWKTGFQFPARVGFYFVRHEAQTSSGSL
jgi:hypothetical protein